MRKKEEKSEIGSLFEFHYVTRQRMGERKIFGMEVKTVGMETVEVIAHNGHSQTVLVGTVYAKLMGSSRVRGK